MCYTMKWLLAGYEVGNNEKSDLQMLVSMTWIPTGEVQEKEKILGEKH